MICGKREGRDQPNQAWTLLCHSALFPRRPGHSLASWEFLKNTETDMNVTGASELDP